MAYSLTLGSARRALSAAPLPRPPEPTRPTLRVSPPAAWTAGATLSTAAEAPIAAEVLRKSRREELRRLKGNSCEGGRKREAPLGRKPLPPPPPRSGEGEQKVSFSPSPKRRGGGGEGFFRHS